MKTTLKQLFLDMILAVLIFTQITGCATTAGLTPAELEIINDPNRSRVFVPANHQIVTNARIPAVNWLRHFIYNVTGTIEWSNGYEEKFNRFGQFYEREKQYVLLAVELHPGQQSKDVTLEITSLGDKLVLSPQPSDPPRWVEPMTEVIILSPVIVFPILGGLPWVLYKMARKATESSGTPEISGRPFAGCCFVWVADVETGESVAGEAPEGAKIVLSETIR